MASSLRCAVGSGAAAITLMAIPLASAVVAQQETAAIMGRVVDARSLAPIRGAVIVVTARPPMPVDTTGHFAQVGLGPGAHRLEARAVGYTIGSWIIILAEGDTLSDVVFGLEPSAYELPAVTTTAEAVSADRGIREFERRRASGVGVFIGPQELERERPTTLSDILRSIPGVTTVCERNVGCYIRMLRAPRGCRAEVFMDGFPATLSTPPNTAARDILAVEVYRSLSETPSEFLRMDNTCGVVAIWTRTGHTDRQ